MKIISRQKKYTIFTLIALFLPACNLINQMPAQPTAISTVTSTISQPETQVTEEQPLAQITTAVESTPSLVRFYPAAFQDNQKSTTPRPVDNIYFLYENDIWYETGIEALEYEIGVLKHRTLEKCTVYLMGYSPHGLGPRGLPIYKNLNGINWGIVHGYLYELPDLITMEVIGLKNPTCQRDVETVLGQLYFQDNPIAKQTPIPTYTPLPAFVCPLAPESRLQTGYGFTTTEVIFRSAPMRTQETAIAKLPAGSWVEILAGPVCGEYPGGAYAYWMVTVKNDQETFIGWLAEGDPNQYYLEQGDCCP